MLTANRTRLVASVAAVALGGCTLVFGWSDLQEARAPDEAGATSSGTPGSAGSAGTSGSASSTSGSTSSTSGSASSTSGSASSTSASSSSGAANGIECQANPCHGTESCCARSDSSYSCSTANNCMGAGDMFYACLPPTFCGTQGGRCCTDGTRSFCYATCSPDAGFPQICDLSGGGSPGNACPFGTLCRTVPGGGNGISWCK